MSLKQLFNGGSKKYVTSGRFHDFFLSWGEFRHHHKVRKPNIQHLYEHI